MTRSVLLPALFAGLSVLLAACASEPSAFDPSAPLSDASIYQHDAVWQTDAETTVTLADLRAHELITSEEREVRIPVGTSLEQADRTLILKTFSFVNGDHHKAAAMLGMDEDKLRSELSNLLSAEPAGAS